MSNKNDKHDRVEYSENPKSEGIITVEMPISNEKSSAEPKAPTPLGKK